MRVAIPPGHAYHLINHGPCCLITTASGRRRNVAPINWTGPLLDEPPLMMTVVEEGICTDTLIRASGEFVINVVGEALASKVLVCGSAHGFRVDKFKKAKLTPAASKRVHAPYVKESVAHIECELVGQHPHDGVTIFVGRVLHAEALRECWNGKHLIPEKARTIHHLSGGAFAVADRTIRVSAPK